MYVLKHGMVHTGNGDAPFPADLRIADGRIQEIGRGLVCPEAEEIDLAGKDIFPGCIDPVCYMGCLNLQSIYKDHNERKGMILPELRAEDSFSAEELVYQQLYKRGITAVGISTGGRNPVSGRMMACCTAGSSIKDMKLPGTAPLRGNFLQSTYVLSRQDAPYPLVRGSALQSVVRILQSVRKEMDAGKELAEWMLPFRELLTGEVPLMAAVEKEAEIRTLLERMKELPVRLILFGAYEAAPFAEELIEKQIPVVLGDMASGSGKMYRKVELEKLVDGVKKGLVLAVSAAGIQENAGRDTFFWNLAELRKNGLSEEEAVTVAAKNPAKILGIEKETGTLEIGKRADLMVFTGHPFVNRTAVPEAVWIQGKPVWLREKRCGRGLAV